MRHKRLLFLFLLPAWMVFATQAWAVQSAPTDVQAAPGDESAAVSFDAPIGDNGSIITGYTVASNPSGGVDSNAGSTALIHVVTGLTNGQAYTFTVTATNSSDETSSASSASNSVTPSTTPCSELAGQWNIGAIMSGQDAPVAEACKMTVNQDGTTSGSCTVNGGSSESLSGNMWLFPDGARPTLTERAGIPQPLIDWLCQPNASGTVIACTATVNDDSGSSYMSVGTKQGASYFVNDLLGQWVFAGLDIGSTYADWDEGNVNVASNGSFFATITKSNGDSQSATGALPVGSNGLVSMDCTSGCSGSTLLGYLDAGKTVIAGLNPYYSGSILQDAELQVVVKQGQGGSYSMADLAGEWISNELRSDGRWRRMVIQVNGDGSYTDSEVYSDGTTSTQSGMLALSSDGLLSCAQNQPAGSGCSDINLVMDASKSVLTGVQTHSSGSVFDIQVVTKTGSLWQNATDLGGGWKRLKWFGDFYVDNSSWIYHNHLGWLYPYGTSTDSIWFYDPAMGAFWWTSASTYPYLYRASDGAWLFYEEGSSNPRWFYNFNTKSWEKH